MFWPFYGSLAQNLDWWLIVITSPTGIGAISITVSRTIRTVIKEKKKHKESLHHSSGLESRKTAKTFSR